jgi:hypothetical protein
MTCAHPVLLTDFLVNRLADSEQFIFEVQLRCSECRVRFRWIGLPVGVEMQRPTTSADGFELRAPIAPDPHMTSWMADTGRARS